MLLIKCNACGQMNKSFKETLQKNSAGVFMVRGDCSHCGKYVMWVPYADSSEVKKALEVYYGQNQML